VNRRAFVAGTLTLFAAPLAALAQQARMVRIGWLLPDPKPFALDPFRQKLKELGWIEGGNLVIEQRYSHGIADLYPQLAAELVRLKVDALVTDGSPATRAAQRTTPTIPIVFVSGDPVAQGFVASLSHPVQLDLGEPVCAVGSEVGVGRQCHARWVIAEIEPRIPGAVATIPRVSTPSARSRSPVR
jgi:ABC-type uncharacterized transport system substrate-binding protein